MFGAMSTLPIYKYHHSEATTCRNILNCSIDIGCLRSKKINIIEIEIFGASSIEGKYEDMIFYSCVFHNMKNISECVIKISKKLVKAQKN